MSRPGVNAEVLVLAGAPGAVPEIARALHAAGLSFGPRELLDEGFANSRLRRVNDRLLALFGGGWDRPVHFPGSWETDPRATALSAEGTAFVYQLSVEPFWAFADSRNSFTVPFWRRVLGAVKVAVCVRNPLDVAMSLHRDHGMSESAALALWEESYRRLLADTAAGERVVTELESWISEPERESSRIASFAGVRLEPRAATAAAGAGFSFEDILAARLAPRIAGMYRDLCIEAGNAAARSWRVPEEANSDTAIDHDAFQAEIARRQPLPERAPAAAPHVQQQLDQLSIALHYLERRIEDLKGERDHARAERDWHARDRDHLAQLLERSREELAAAHAAEISALESKLRDEQSRRREIETAMIDLERSRLGRLQRRWWRFAAGFRRR